MTITWARWDDLLAEREIEKLNEKQAADGGSVTTNGKKEMIDVNDVIDYDPVIALRPQPHAADATSWSNDLFRAADLRALLVGATIMDVQVEEDEFGMNPWPLLFVKTTNDEALCLAISMDDDGNGGGFIRIDTAQVEAVA